MSNYFEELDDNAIFFDKVKKNNIDYNFIPGLSVDDAILEINKLIGILEKEQEAEEQKQREKQTKEQSEQESKTKYMVGLYNNEGDIDTSTDCKSYDEAIKAMEDYKSRKTQYVDSWGLSGKGVITRYTEDKDGNITNEKVLKTFWL